MGRGFKHDKKAHIRMKQYNGTRTEDGCDVMVTEAIGSTTRHYPLHPRNYLRNHSPTGFEWGYGGSGPAQLALAIVMDATGSAKKALNIYQKFKFAVIARLPKEHWRLTQAEVIKACESLKEARHDD